MTPLRLPGLLLSSVSLLAAAETAPPPRRDPFAAAEAPRAAAPAGASAPAPAAAISPPEVRALVRSGTSAVAVVQDGDRSIVVASGRRFTWKGETLTFIGGEEDEALVRDRTGAVLRCPVLPPGPPAPAPPVQPGQEP